MRSLAISLFALTLLISSTPSLTLPVKTAYLNPTRLEILRTVEMGAYRRIMYAKQELKLNPDLVNLGQFFG